MSTLATLVVLAIGINVGIILHICWEELLLAIERARFQFLLQQSRDEDDAAMDAAVALTQEKLGGTILDYGPNV